MIKVYPFLFVCITLNLQSQTNQNFKIQGYLNSVYEGYIYLKYGTNLDSSLVKNQTFYFENNVDYPTEAYFYMDRNSPIGHNFYLENTEMDIALSLREDKSLKIDKLEGNPTAMKLEELELFFGENVEKEDFQDLLFEKLSSLIVEEPKNQFYGELLTEFEDVLNFDHYSKLYRLLDTTAQIPENLELIKSLMRKKVEFYPGSQLGNVTFLDLNLNEVSTGNFQNHILLIEFWATWCRPCIEEFPQLKLVYEKFSNKGFEILGVSLDQDVNQAREMVSQNRLKWVQSWADSGWENEQIQKLGIFTIPSNFLVDKNGTIVKVNISIEELESYLENNTISTE